MKELIKYFSVSANEENWGFYITTTGHKKVKPHESYPNEKLHPMTHAFTWHKGRILNDYSMVFITNGSGVFENVHGKYIVESGSVFLLYPDEWHRYKPDTNTGWEEYWISFKGNYPEFLMQKNFPFKEKPIIQTGCNEQLQMLLHDLIKKIDIGISGYQQIISGITLQILGILSHSHKNLNLNVDDKDKELIKKAVFFLNERISDKIDLELLARELPMGYSRFRKLFKNVVGISPNQYILSLRLEEAKTLLKTSTLSINEIAHRCGFESVPHFCKFFQQKNNISASQFRNSAVYNLTPV